MGNGIAAICGVALFALAAPQASAQDAPASDPKASKTVCKSSIQTGTRFRKRVCRTAKEWDELAELSRQAGKEMVDRASALAQVKQNGPT